MGFLWDSGLSFDPMKKFGKGETFNSYVGNTRGLKELSPSRLNFWNTS
jgi:hypothetical protein